jgi:hypothetical protein
MEIEVYGCKECPLAHKQYSQCYGPKAGLLFIEPFLSAKTPGNAVHPSCPLKTETITYSLTKPKGPNV